MKRMKLTILDIVYSVLGFVLIIVFSGFLHELGHFLTCKIIYGNGCMIGFGFDLCKSLWPICIGHPPNIAVEAAGGIFSGIILLGIYYPTSKMKLIKKPPLKFVIGSIFFVLAFMQITQGLEEGFLPSIYSNQSSIWNVIILIAGTVAGVLCFLWINKRFHVAQSKRK